MDQEKEVKAKIIKILETAKPKKKKASAKKAAIIEGDISGGQVQVGDGNIQAGGDLILTEKITHKVVAEVKPGLDHITDEQAATLLTKIHEITRFHNIAKRRQVTPQHFWSMLNRRFRVPRYRLIKLKDYHKAITWCNQQLAIFSGTKTFQKKDPEAVRRRQISFIQTNLTQFDLRPLYRNYLKAAFGKASTADLDPNELKKAYTWVSDQKKKRGN